MTINRRLENLYKVIGSKEQPHGHTWTIEELKDRPGYFEFKGKILTENEISQWLGPNEGVILVIRPKEQLSPVR